jgi:hypothetical protein
VVHILPKGAVFLILKESKVKGKEGETRKIVEKGGGRKGG